MDSHGIYGNNSSISFPFNDEPHILDNVYVQAALITLYSIIFLICFVGNLAVILVVSLKWKMRNVTKFCLGNLAIADLTVGLFCIYQNLTTYLLDSWYFGDFMCKMYHFTNSLCHTASILILVVIAIERYMALAFPFRSRQLLTIKRLIFIIAAVWLLSAVISSPRLFYFGVLHIPTSDAKTGKICVPKKSMYNSATADTIYFIVLYVIPLGVITILYTRIAVYLRESERIRNEFDHDCNTIQRAIKSSVQFHGRESQGRSSSASSVGRDEGDGRMENGPSSTIPSASTSGFAFTFRGHVVQQGGDSQQSRPSTTGDCDAMQQLSLFLRSLDQHPPIEKFSSRHPSSGIRFVSLTRSSAFSDNCIYTSRRRSSEILREEATDIVDGRRTYGNPFGIQRRLGHGGRQFYYKADSSTVQNFQVRDSEDSTESEGSSEAPHTSAIRSRRVALHDDARRMLYHYNLFRLRRIRYKQRKNVVRMFISIVITFAVLNLPFHVRKLCINYMPSFDMASDASTLIAPITFLLMYANCAINPILYAFMSKHFRTSLKDLCYQCRYQRVEQQV